MNYSQAQDGRARSEPGRGGGSWSRGTPRDLPGWGGQGRDTPVPGAPRWRCEGPRGVSPSLAPRSPEVPPPAEWLAPGMDAGGRRWQVWGHPQGVVGMPSISCPGPESARGDSNEVMSQVPCAGGTPNLPCPAPWVSHRMLGRHSSRTRLLCLQETPGEGSGGWNIAGHICSTRGSQAFNDNKK